MANDYYYRVKREIGTQNGDDNHFFKTKVAERVILFSELNEDNLSTLSYVRISIGLLCRLTLFIMRYFPTNLLCMR